MTSFQLVTLDFWENVYNNVSHMYDFIFSVSETRTHPVKLCDYVLISSVIDGLDVDVHFISHSLINS